jgi:hypothetical protein
LDHWLFGFLGVKERVAFFVQPLFHAVDPAKAQRLFHCMIVRNARLARGLLVKDQPNFFAAREVLRDPAALFGAIGSEDRLHRNSADQFHFVDAVYFHHHVALGIHFESGNKLGAPDHLVVPVGIPRVDHLAERVVKSLHQNQQFRR